MNKELVKIKGGTNGFQLVIDTGANLEEIKAELEKKLMENPEFFPQGTGFQLVSAELDKLVKRELGLLLEKKGMVMQRSLANSREKEIPRPQENISSEMKVINHTVRNGEEIISNGSIMICGNVNPGAKIMAAGSIDIRGTCRGIVHAGIYGDIDACVVADRLLPTQIRIADFIARSPDDAIKNEFPEKAFIKNGHIIIEPIER